MGSGLIQLAPPAGMSSRVPPHGRLHAASGTHIRPTANSKGGAARPDRIAQSLRGDAQPVLRSCTERPPPPDSQVHHAASGSHALPAGGKGMCKERPWPTSATSADNAIGKMTTTCEVPILPYLIHRARRYHIMQDGRPQTPKGEQLAPIELCSRCVEMPSQR